MRPSRPGRRPSRLRPIKSGVAPQGDGTKTVGTARRRPHICWMPDPTRGALCPICGKPVAEPFRPFCSRRCADVDLNRWFSGVYAVPVTEDEEEDERRDDGGEAPN
jgi:endogenous inhibitor of DNA gyrase (YacG/DUF329 family)